MASPTRDVSTSPSGFDRDFTLPATERGATIGVGFDVDRGRVRRFLVQLQHVAVDGGRSGRQIARIDHNPASTFGHDVLSEGIHVDVVLADGSERTLRPRGGAPVNQKLGVVINVAIEYFQSHSSYFLGVHDGAIEPRDPPRWP